MFFSVVYSYRNCTLMSWHGIISTWQFNGGLQFQGIRFVKREMKFLLAFFFSFFCCLLPNKLLIMLSTLKYN